MRCNNCGWQNKDSRIRCEKCNYPLDGSSNMDELKNVPNHLSNDPATKLSSTIKGSQPMLDPWDIPNSGELNANRNSDLEDRDRSYPPPPVYQSNNQQTEQQKPHQEATETPPAPEPDSVPFSGDYGQKFSQTFDPSRVRAKNRTFRLKLITREGETIDKDLPFSGETIELNRNNVDPDNFSITSKTQAIVEHIDGAWYIVDKSELKTTFVQVNEPYKIESGDIILLGDRKFIFEE